MKLYKGLLDVFFMAFQRIPFKDIQLGSSAEESMNRVLAEQGACVLEGINPKPIEALYAALQEFFASSLKKRYELDRPFCGYMTSGYGAYPREEFTLDDSAYELHDEERKLFCERGVRMVKNKWPTHRDFPGLESVFTRVYGDYLHVSHSLNSSQAFLTGFCYYSADASRFPNRISAHKDDSYTLAFHPLGEPLEVVVAGQNVQEELACNEALLIAPETYHFVRNLHPDRERYSLTYSFSPFVL
ncbi:hypothetical protein EXS74_01965 [Candidatus Woesearchaeota archaeon]|nr:hypothetical protein [Candidatus Woesearchaeota archaeon]